MKNIFQNKKIAVAVLIAAILLSSVIGIAKKPQVETPEGSVALDESLNTAAFSQYIIDDAGLLSAKTEESLALYNANWDKKLGAIMAVVTLDSAADAEDAAWDWAERLELGEDDAIVVMVKDTRDYKVVASGGFYDFFDELSPGFVDSCMYEGVQSGDYDFAMIALFTYVHGELCNAGYYSNAQSDDGSAVFGIIAVLLLCFLLFMLIDRMRYRRYQRRVNRGVVIVRPYYPIFWGRPRYRRPPPPPRPPHSGGPRPPMGGSRPSGGAFRSKPTQHSSFGGSRPSGGSFRSGSFGGGSRGGSFGGGGRSGGFGGGSRGGGFGGRR